MGDKGIKRLLVGDGEDVHAALERHLRGLREFLPKRYGNSQQFKQSLLEVDVLLTLPRTRDGLACKRAALLFALWREKEVLRVLEREEGVGKDSFARDLAERVLPLVGPLYLRNSCQAPDGFVIAVLVLAELWRGERLGNWPKRRRELTTMVPESI